MDLILLRPLPIASSSTRNLRRTLVANGLVWDELWCSADDAAQSYAAELKRPSEPPPSAVAALSPPPAPKLFALLENAAASRLAIVANEPLPSQLIATLVLGLPQMAHRDILSPGAVAWLEGDPEPGGMQLKAHLTPAMLSLDP